MDRPYADYSTDDLFLVFAEAPYSKETLLTVQAELPYRNPRNVKNLRTLVDDALERLKALEIIECGHCGKKMRVPLREGAHQMCCAACRGVFVVNYQPGRMSIVFTPTSPMPDEAKMTASEAYRLFNATPETPWSDIERVRRRLIQQIHTDKWEQYGEALRSHFDNLAQKLNVAYAILKQSRNII